MFRISFVSEDFLPHVICRAGILAFQPISKFQILPLFFCWAWLLSEISSFDDVLELGPVNFLTVGKHDSDKDEHSHQIHQLLT